MPLLEASLYRTVQDDTFDAAAYRIWGRETMARELIAANPEHADVVFFSPGVELAVPDVEVPASTADLPAWVTDDGE